MYSKITTSKQIKNSAQNTCFKIEQAQQVSNPVKICTLM